MLDRTRDGERSFLAKGSGSHYFFEGARLLGSGSGSPLKNIMY